MLPSKKIHLSSEIRMDLHNAVLNIKGDVRVITKKRSFQKFGSESQKQRRWYIKRCCCFLIHKVNFETTSCRTHNFSKFKLLRYFFENSVHPFILYLRAKC